MRQLIALCLLLLAAEIQARQVVDLSGFYLSQKALPPTIDTQWAYQCYDSSYYKDKWYEPYRSAQNYLNPHFLTPKTYFVGDDDYVFTVDVPADWKDQIVTLHLERVHIKSHVWVNGVEATALYHSPAMDKGCRSLAAPHEYDLTGLVKAGKPNEIRINVSNTLDLVPVGHNSYSLSDDDQGNWNGIIGRVEISAVPQTHIVAHQTRIFTDVDQSLARAYINICVGQNQDNKKGEKQEGSKAQKPQKLTLRLQTEAGEVTIPFIADSDTLRQIVELHNLTQLWDEYTPNLYHLTISLHNGWPNKKGVLRSLIDSQSVTFGMRKVEARGHFIEVNNRKTLIRGNVDGAHFPLTGYPPTDVDYWMQYFRTVREWGTNTVRFHSWCPPEAAFIAADSLGVYLQPECSSWPNHIVRIKPGNETAQYIWEEAEQIVQAYGNHPSFVFLAAGNEPGGGDYPEFSKLWVEHWKQTDPRRLYTSFSVGGSWPWDGGNQFQVRAGQRGLNWSRSLPEGKSDFSAFLDTCSVPFIGHEVGQWCSYPDLSEIDKYTGLMQPSNLIIFRDRMRQNGLLYLADKFLKASGRLQTIYYKHELERVRRTANYAGYHLQALADYPGQASATEGVLNVFYEPKGYCTKEEWNQWAGPVVALMRTDRFVYKTSDTLQFSLEVSNFSGQSLADVYPSYSLTDQNGKIVTQSIFQPQTFAHASLTEFARVSLPLADLTQGLDQLTLTVRVGDCSNQWKFWIYPEAPEISRGDVYVTRVPDPKAMQTLRNGGKVLLLGQSQILSGRNIRQLHEPIFWNVLWLARYSSHTAGLLIDHTHPVFRNFITSYHSDVQWWELVHRSKPIYLDQFPAELQPMVRTIDNAYDNRSLGMMFEVKVGKGSLLVTNFDLETRMNERIVARQLLYSILEYMKSYEFNPSCSITEQQLMEMFTIIRN